TLWSWQFDNFDDKHSLWSILAVEIEDKQNLSPNHKHQGKVPFYIYSLVDT
ncbi:hypothetical protein ACH5RR_007138, partial [Cinchona calisaya]